MPYQLPGSDKVAISACGWLQVIAFADWIFAGADQEMSLSFKAQSTENLRKIIYFQTFALDSW